MSNAPGSPASAEPEIIAADVVSTGKDTELSPNERLAASRWQVLVLLFLAAGPLGLPVLFRSPRFSRFWKIVLFLLVLVQTALVIAIVVLFAGWFADRMQQLRGL